MPVIKQWVNLDPDEREELRDVPGEGPIPPERCGPVIHLRATIDQELGGLPVWWGVEPHAENCEPGGAPSDDWARNRLLAGLEGVPGFYERLAITDGGGEVTGELHVPECGGDRYTVKAFTKNEDGSIRDELQSETYETWRQLYYQVTRMGAGSGRESLPAIPDLTTWNDVKNEFNDSRMRHHIRFTEVPAAQTTITRHRSLWNDEMIKRTGVEGYDRSKEPLVLKVSLVDLLAFRGQEDHTFETVQRYQEYTGRTAKPLFDINSVDDKNDWYLAAVARASDGSAVRITRDDFTKVGANRIRLRLDAAPVCRSARVTVRVYVFEKWLGGRSWANGIWVINGCGRWRGGEFRIETDSMETKAQIMVHEWGHAIGMVPAASPKHYPTSHGHRGDHCWNGATDPTTFPATESYDDHSDGACCTMFGCVSCDTIRFCDVCSPFVRSRRPSVDGNFQTSLMMPAGWGGTA